MSGENIHVTVDAEGGVTVEAIGYTGNACLKELDNILQGLLELGVSIEDKNIQMKASRYVTRMEGRTNTLK